MGCEFLPKPTFFNLPEEKRNLIFHHALLEFAQFPYEQASLSAIVSRAAIAKGSMYQYFADKKDLYKYVVQEVYQKKREFLQPVWDQKEKVNFFELASLYYQRSWHFARQYPLYHQVTVNFWDSRDAAVREEILRKKEIRITEFSDMLELGLLSGVVTPEADKDAVWFVYHAVAKALIDNFLDTSVNAESHEAYINSVLTVLERGLRPRKE
ncbi:MAG TPA: hypothetical protein DEA85_07710 [Firmicutes bacterium]|nr:hypothetical protein [Bacillota bacterium]